MAGEQESVELFSLVQAIENKYADGGDTDDTFHVQIFVPKSAPGQKDTGEIIVPTELSINNQEICCAGDENKITELCSGVTFLDLSENKIESWEEVFKILDGMPLCSFLDLRKNPLNHQINDFAEKQFPNLIKLVLNDLGLPWNSIVQLLDVLPNLYELHLSLNKYSNVEIPEGKHYPEIKVLNFFGNNIDNWAEISKLGKAFPNLEVLILLENPLETLPSLEEMVKYFANLQTISVSKTRIPNWSELQKFRHFPKLTHIRLQGIQFLEEYKEELRRQLILAYLPNIKRLNGGKVAETEREPAERAMIRHYMDKSEPLPARYHELEALHGKLDPLVNINLSDCKTFSVAVQYKDKSFLHTVNDIWTREEFKESIRSKVDNLKLSRMIVFQQNPNDTLCEMKHPRRTLSVYTVSEGDTFFIEEKPMNPHLFARRKKVPSSSISSKKAISSKKNVPLKAVQSRMIQEGLNPALLELNHEDQSKSAESASQNMKRDSS